MAGSAREHRIPSSLAKSIQTYSVKLGQLLLLPLIPQVNDDRAKLGAGFESPPDKFKLFEEFKSIDKFESLDENTQKTLKDGIIEYIGQLKKLDNRRDQITRASYLFLLSLGLIFCWSFSFGIAYWWFQVQFPRVTLLLGAIIFMLVVICYFLLMRLFLLPNFPMSAARVKGLFFWHITTSFCYMILFLFLLPLSKNTALLNTFPSYMVHSTGVLPYIYYIVLIAVIGNLLFEFFYSIVFSFFIVLLPLAIERWQASSYPVAMIVYQLVHTLCSLINSEKKLRELLAEELKEIKKLEDLEEKELDELKRLEKKGLDELKRLEDKELENSNRLKKLEDFKNLVELQKRGLEEFKNLEESEDLEDKELEEKGLEDIKTLKTLKTKELASIKKLEDLDKKELNELAELADLSKFKKLKREEDKELINLKNANLQDKELEELTNLEGLEKEAIQRLKNLADSKEKLLQQRATIDLHLLIKRKQLAAIEIAARCLESTLPGQLQSGDIITQVWLEKNMREAANALREKKRWILTPKADTHSYLIDSLTSMLICVVDGNWDALERIQYSQLAHPHSWRTRIIYPIRLFGEALLPFLLCIFLVFFPPLSAFIPTVFKGYLMIGSAFWIFIVLITALDPDFNDKVNDIKNLLSLSSINNDNK